MSVYMVILMTIKWGYFYAACVAGMSQYVLPLKKVTSHAVILKAYGYSVV